MKVIDLLATGALVVGLSACGGGGSEPVPGSSGNPGGGANLPVTISNLVVQLDKASAGNSESEQLKVVVRAIDSSSKALANAPVVVTVDAGGVLEPYPEKTDAQGKLEAIILVGLADRSNRTMTVTVKSGAITKVVKFDVIGAKLTATAVPKVVEPIASARILYQLVDVNGNPMRRQAIKVEKVAGANRQVVAEGETDINGGYNFEYAAPPQEGTVTYVASAGGVSVSETIMVSKPNGTSVDIVPVGSVKSASVAANPNVVMVNSGATKNQAAVRALFVGANSKPIQNIRVRFEEAGATKYGSFTTGSTIVYSDANGVAASAYVPGLKYSPTDGVKIRACWAYSNAEFDANPCPNVVETSLTVVEEAISVSIGTNNKLILNPLSYSQEFLVQVVDAAGNPKPGVEISATLELLRFAKGAWFYSSADKQWVASYTQSFRDERDFFQDPITGNLVFNPNYGKIWYLQDPRSDAQQASDPQGAPLIDDLMKRAACWNEDRDRDGARTYAEDDPDPVKYSKDYGGNGNGTLDPAASGVSITNLAADKKTDTNGQVKLRIEYLQNLASWLEYKIVVSGKVGGTEGRATWMDHLGVPAEAVKAETEPPFVRSFFGVEQGCTNPR